MQSTIVCAAPSPACSGKAPFFDIFYACSGGAKTAFQQICPLTVRAEELGEVCRLCCGCEMSCELLSVEGFQHSIES